MTEKLYYEDPGILSFEATVLRQEHRGDHWVVVLDRSAFYPEGGGQPADRGFLNRTAVIDVQEADGEIFHRVEQPLEAAEGVGAGGAPGRVTGRIDEVRRRTFAGAHTAQHVVSAALAEAAGAATLSVHLSEDYFTVELDRDTLGEAQLEAAEALANRMVTENRKVQIRWVDRRDLPGLRLRKAPPPGLERLRLVEIPDCDLSACGGLHVSSTGEVGLIQLAGMEKIRGRVRLSFRAGDAAYRAARGNERVLQGFTRELGCRREELSAALAGVKEKLKAREQEAVRLRRRLAPLAAEELRERGRTVAGIRVVVCRLDPETPGLGDPEAAMDGELAEAIFRALVSAPRTVAVLVRREAERLRWAAGHSPDLGLELGAVLGPHLQLISGKGGGRGALLQGIGSRVDGADRFVDAVESALERALAVPRASKQPDRDTP
jgi:alanyl-tRNA synthetase